MTLPLAHEWAPAAPAGLAALARVDALVVSWDAAVAAAPEVGSHTLWYRRAGAGARFVAVDVASGRSVRLDPLEAGVSYEMFVTAANFNGTGAVSATVTAAALESPCGLQAVAGALVGETDGHAEIAATGVERQGFSPFEPQVGLLPGSR